MTTFTLTGTFTHQNGTTPISKSPIHVHADPFPLGSTVQTDRVEKVTDANGTVTFTLSTGVTGLYYVVRSTAKRPLFKPIRFLAPAAGTVLNINTLIFYNPGDPPLEQDLIAIRDLTQGYANQAAGSVSLVAWAPATAYTAGDVRQAPDGTAISRKTSGTSASTFAADAVSWTPVETKAGTLAQVALDAAFGNYVSVKDQRYGAKGDGTTDDTAAIQAAHTALPSTGGVIYLPPGTYKLSSALTFTKPVTIFGAGGAIKGDGDVTPPRAMTTIIVSSATNDGLVFTSPGVTLSDIAVVCDATTPTAGTGVKMTGSHAASHASLRGVTVMGFFDCMAFQGVYYTLTGCHIYDPVRYGYYFPNPTDGNYTDHGDMGLVNCVASMFWTTRTPAALLRWEGGGGLRVVGCKLNGGQQPNAPLAGKPVKIVDIAVADGVLTGLILLSGNSFSGGTTNQISLGYSGTGTGLVTKVTIVGNDIGVGYGTGDGIQVGTDNTFTHTTIVRNVIIAYNNFNSVVNGIKGGGCTDLLIGRNAFMGTTTPINLDQYNGTRRTIEPQHIDNNSTQTIYNANRTLDQAPLQLDEVVHDYSRSLQTSSGTPNQSRYLVRGAVGTTRGGSFIIDFEVYGYNDSVGAVSIIGQRIVTYDITPTYTVTTVGTDTVVGNVSVTFGSSASGVTFSVTATHATNKTINGEVRIRTRGQIGLVQQS